MKNNKQIQNSLFLPALITDLERSFFSSCLDEQTCDMIFGSWSHTGSLIHYQFWNNKPELPQYTPNNEWKLLAVAQSIKTVDYPNWVEPDPFFEINFSILIVRKPLQAIYNTVVPALMLTTLTLVSFFVSKISFLSIRNSLLNIQIPFAQEMQIGISIMLAYSVFSLRLSEDVPSQSDSVHLISLYLTVCMFFSLSAMTWFAIVNKLREKKRLPYWLRWLALDYIAWIVCATSMHRKARRAVKQEELKITPTTPSTPDTIPLQQITTTAMIPTEYSNNYYFERDSLSTGIGSKAPLLSRTQIQPSFDQSINETDKPTDQSSPTSVWIRRRATNIPLSSSTITTNGPSNKKLLRLPKASTQTSKYVPVRSINKNKESLYAIHIYNRLVFLMFFLTVIAINIYTWFFYSRTVRTKLLDDQIPWSCYDESRLAIVNCSFIS